MIIHKTWTCTWAHCHTTTCLATIKHTCHMRGEVTLGFSKCGSHRFFTFRERKRKKRKRKSDILFLRRWQLQSVLCPSGEFGRLSWISLDASIITICCCFWCWISSNASIITMLLFLMLNLHDFRACRTISSLSNDVCCSNIKEKKKL